MSETSNDILRRAFANAPVVGHDEAFVSRLSTGLAGRRHRRRLAFVGVCIAAAVGVAMGLSLVAPTSQLSDAGLSLLRLPERIGDVASTRAQLLPTDPWLYLVVAACVLPLAGTAWFVRRAWR